jgi:hypothetical protein
VVPEFCRILDRRAPGKAGNESGKQVKRRPRRLLEGDSTSAGPGRMGKLSKFQDSAPPMLTSIGWC